MTSDENTLLILQAMKIVGLHFLGRILPSIKYARSNGSQELLGYVIKRIVHKLKKDLAN